MNFIFTIILFMERKLKNINFLSILKPLICFTNDHFTLVCISQTTPFCLRQYPAVLAILWSNFGWSFDCDFLLKRSIACSALGLFVSNQKSLSLCTGFDKWYFYERLAPSQWSTEFLRLYSGGPPGCKSQSFEEDVEK